MIGSTRSARGFTARGFISSRSLALGLVASLTLQLSPLPVLARTVDDARTSSRVDLAPVRQMVARDLTLLKTQGKEAYLDRLFERLDQDRTRAQTLVDQVSHTVGGRMLGRMILSLGSPVLAAVLAAIPDSWESAIVSSVLSRFVAKAVSQIKQTLAGLSAGTLETGLTRLSGLLDKPPTDAGGSASGQAWWEKFFGNSTIVKNFLITVVVLSSIGVAVGLAIAGSTAAPVVAVVGAIVSLIALLQTSKSMPSAALDVPGLSRG